MSTWGWSSYCTVVLLVLEQEEARPPQGGRVRQGVQGQPGARGTFQQTDAGRGQQFLGRYVRRGMGKLCKQWARGGVADDSGKDRKTGLTVAQGVVHDRLLLRYAGENLREHLLDGPGTGFVTQGGGGDGLGLGDPGRAITPGRTLRAPQWLTLEMVEGAPVRPRRAFRAGLLPPGQPRQDAIEGRHLSRDFDAPGQRTAQQDQRSAAPVRDPGVGVP